MKTACAETERGFTLLELSVVLVLIGTLTAMGLVTLTGSIQASQYNKTVERMDAIEKALLNFAIANNRIPCPSNLTITPGSANYGAEAGSASANTAGTCHGGTPAANFHSTAGVEEGGLPTRALGLPDSWMYDGWGNRFRYAVDPTMTATAALPVQASTCSAASASPITINDSTGAARTTAGIYALISHGANGHGAYTSNGATISAGSVNHDEQINCHCDNTGASNGYPLTSFQPAGTATGLTNTTYVEKLPTLDNTSAIDNFDDIVTFKEGWQMQAPNYPLSQTVTQCIYVVDNNRVEKFNMSGTFVAGIGAGYNGVTGGIGSSGAGNGQFSQANFIAFDSAGNLWVTDYGNRRVQEFNSSGTYVGQIVGGWGSANGNLLSPQGVAIDSSNNVWVVDGGNNRVQKFNNSGSWLQSIGGPSPYTCEASPAGSPPACASGTGSGQFNAAAGGIRIDASGNVWVADTGNNRVEEFNSSGSFLLGIGAGYQGIAGSVGSSGALNGQLNAPAGITIDPSGNIWVIDDGNERVQKFNSSGTYISKFGGAWGSANGLLDWPTDLTIDSSGNIWLTDGLNHRVQKFNSSGSWLQSIGGPSPYACETSPAGSPPACAAGTGSGQFSGPTGIGIGSR